MSDVLDPRLTFAAYLGTLLLAVVEGDDYWLPLGREPGKRVDSGAHGRG